MISTYKEILSINVGKCYSNEKCKGHCSLMFYLNYRGLSIDWKKWIWSLQCFKNRTGPAGLTGPIINRGLIQSSIEAWSSLGRTLSRGCHQTAVELVSSAVKPLTRQTGLSVWACVSSYLIRPKWALTLLGGWAIRRAIWCCLWEGFMCNIKAFFFLSPFDVGLVGGRNEKIFSLIMGLLNSLFRIASFLISIFHTIHPTS